MNKTEQSNPNSIFNLIAVFILILGLNGLGFAAPADDLAQAKAAARVQDFNKAARLLTPLAEEGNTDAQFQLAGLFRAGRGVPKNHKSAVFWLKKASFKGHADAQYHLGVMYEKGWGVEIDSSQAIKWYQAAAKQGSEMAWKKFKALKQLEVTQQKDPRYKRNQALLDAATDGRAEEVENLIRKGAEINDTDTQGRTPLILAVEKWSIVGSTCSAEIECRNNRHRSFW